MTTTTINDSRLMLHCGARAVDFDTVKRLPTPAGTDTHCPIPHAFMVREVSTQLQNMGFAITGEAHALWNTKEGPGMRYFGLLGLMDRTKQADSEVGAGRQFVFGLRNSHDKEIVAGGVLGTQVFVCDNLAFHSRAAEFHFARKHTRWALRDLPGIVADKLAGLRESMQAVERREASYAAFNLQEADERCNLRPGTVLHDLLVRCMRAGAFTSHAVPQVLREFTRDDGPGGRAEAAGIEAWTKPTMYRFLQAVTQVNKKRPNLHTVRRRADKLMGVLDGAVASWS